MGMERLVLKNRSYRRFQESDSIAEQTLIELVNLARLSPSRANLQPLCYLLSSSAENNDLIFPHLNWAGYLKDWRGPSKGERPSAYVVILGDKSITENFGCDHGIAAQNILLGAIERGLGGCMGGGCSHKRLREILSIPEQYEIMLVLALGKPIEEVSVKPVGADGNVKYWRDENCVHHVPKRKLVDVIVEF